MSNKGRKLLERARSTTAGWRTNDLLDLYESYGFEFREGRGHIIASHPEYKELRATISRSSGELANGYARHAVKTIEKLLELQGGSDG
jgi:hypothetical protein